MEAVEREDDEAISRTREDAEVEEGSDGPDSYNWVSTKICNTKAMFKTDVPLSSFGKYITTPEGQRWKLESDEDCVVCTKVPDNYFRIFFFGVLMGTMGIRIPLTEFQQGVLDFLRLAPNA